MPLNNNMNIYGLQCIGKVVHVDFGEKRNLRAAIAGRMDRKDNKGKPLFKESLVHLNTTFRQILVYTVGVHAQSEKKLYKNVLTVCDVKSY